MRKLDSFFDAFWPSGIALSAALAWFAFRKRKVTLVPGVKYRFAGYTKPPLDTADEVGFATVLTATGAENLSIKKMSDRSVFSYDQLRTGDEVTWEMPHCQTVAFPEVGLAGQLCFTSVSRVA